MRVIVLRYNFFFCLQRQIAGCIQESYKCLQKTIGIICCNVDEHSMAQENVSKWLRYSIYIPIPNMGLLLNYSITILILWPRYICSIMIFTFYLWVHLSVCLSACNNSRMRVRTITKFNTMSMTNRIFILR